MDQDKIDAIMAGIEHLRPQIEKEVGKFQFEVRDPFGAVNIYASGETFVAVLDEENVLVVPESKYIDDRVPPLVQQLFRKRINEINDTLDRFTDKTDWSTDWVMFIKNPETNRWFVSVINKEGDLTFIPRELYESISGEEEENS